MITVPESTLRFSILRCSLVLLVLLPLALLSLQHYALGSIQRIPPVSVAVSRSFDRTVELHTRTLLRNGPPAAAVDLVFLSEAYPAGQASAFFDDAARVIHEHFEAGTGAFTGIRPLFNVHALFLPSVGDRVVRAKQALPSHNQTAFGCFREPNMLRAIFPGMYTNQRATAECQERLGCDSCDFLVLLVNDPWYGGLADSTVTIITNSRTTGAVSARHELAHAFADMGEEYDGSAGGEDYSGSNYAMTLRTCSAGDTQAERPLHPAGEVYLWRLLGWVAGRSHVYLYYRTCCAREAAARGLRTSHGFRKCMQIYSCRRRIHALIHVPQVVLRGRQVWECLSWDRHMSRSTPPPPLLHPSTLTPSPTAPASLPLPTNSLP